MADRCIRRFRHPLGLNAFILETAMSEATQPPDQGDAAKKDARPQPVGSPSDVIALIVDREDTFSKSRKKIANAILTDPRTFVEKPVEELIPWLGVSAPTIARFANSLGCDGLRDLKLKIMGSMRIGIRYLEPPTPPETIEEVMERVVKRAQSAISEARHNLDLRAAENIVETIIGCRTLYAFGSGGVSSWLVEEIKNRFFRLGLRVVPSSDHQMQVMLAATMESGDVVLCSSLSGANKELLRAISIARDYGATTIGLAPPDTPVAEAVDQLLAVDVSEDREVLNATSLRFAFLIAVDLLAFTTAVHPESRAREKLRRIVRHVSALRDSDEPKPLSD